MTKPVRRAHPAMIGTVLLTVAASPCAAFAGSATPYLTWQNKAPASSATSTPAEVHTTSGSYPVPPSPYGQVGDPYARSLSWPTKGAAPQPQPEPQQVATVQPPVSQPLPQQPVFVAVPAPPMRNTQVASISTPVPLSRPAPVAVVPLPPIPQETVPQPEDPGLADDPGMADDAPMAAPAPAVSSIQPLPPQFQAQPERVPDRVQERPVVAPPAPQPALPKVESRPEPALAVASVPAPQPTPEESAPPAPAIASAIASDGAYQVPSNSKYAARIAAARAAQLPQAQVVPAEPVQQADARPAPQPTVPEPTESLAAQETDHVFIPGELIRTPADEPRQYSLHRQYGMRPDPIQVDHNATGALLTVSPEVQGGDPNDDTDDTPPTPPADGTSN